MKKKIWNVGHLNDGQMYCIMRYLDGRIQLGISDPYNTDARCDVQMSAEQAIELANALIAKAEGHE